ncbi:metalloregulator ArsR/SmtB family transcription factor [Prosthecobacter sp.]|uniref:ArsR/SmtB family transcription factor n=1 Tax=Prosthecobacter sp. TaxID=1965333 RepID=UPI002ABABE31|nr:metalloregulator ArsR/SmtB family transcription factor [Prosthecobacter sp.]MDZ4405476.1 metalloregulator ArsR/SmtB family transcription factor [Prosthecobacter sp.]
MPAARKKTLPPVSDEALALIASWFRTLAEPSRLKILRALEEGGELNITELVAATSLTQANVSRHVQSLVDAGMVGRRKEGLTVICFIADPGITDLCDNVCNNLMKRLSHQVKKLGGS